MITDFDENLADFEQAARTFATKELSGRVEANDRHPFAPLFDDAIANAWESGFFSIVLPEAMGGIDLLCTVLDRISQVDASLAAMGRPMRVQARTRFARIFNSCPAFSHPSGGDVARALTRPNGEGLQFGADALQSAR